MAGEDQWGEANPIIGSAGGDGDPVPDLDGRSVEQRGEVAGRPGGGSGRARLGLLIGLVAVVGALWGLGRLGSDQGSATGAAAGTGPGGREPASDFSLDAGSSPEPDEPRVVIGVTPATRGPSATFPAGPVIDVPTGLTLFYGGEAPLQAVDLDTGELTTYGIRAQPVLASGGSLVIHQPATDLLSWVDLDEPGQQPAIWKAGRVAPGPGPGLLWVLDPESDGSHPAGAEAGSGRWDLFDTSQDRVVSRIPGELYDEVEAFLEPSPAVGGWFDALHPGPLLSTRPDGVHRYDEEGYRRLSPGRVLVDDAARGLVSTGPCGPDGPCDLVWIDTGNGAAIDLPLPGVRPRVATIVGGGRWLHSVAWDGTSELLDLTSGRRIEHVWSTTRPAVSPDGRWLAEWFGTTVVISDLDVDGRPKAVGHVQDFQREGPGSLVFALVP